MSEPVVVWQSGPEQFRYTLQRRGAGGLWVDKVSGDSLDALVEAGNLLARIDSCQVRIIDRQPGGPVLVVE